MEESKLPDPQQVAASWRERLDKLRAHAEANAEIAIQAANKTAERYLKAKWGLGGKASDAGATIERSIPNDDSNN